MDDGTVDSLLRRFVDDAGRAVPLVAVWVHGSLALGDFQVGRSDFDLIAVVTENVSKDQQLRLARLHRKLVADIPLAEKLHCSYMAVADLADPGLRHVTWAHRRLFTRPVTAVTRRELAEGGRCLFGTGPAGLLPPVSDADLVAFIRRDLKEFWYPAARKPPRWLWNVWVDLGTVTLARAAVTLRDGRLISKREALDVLLDLGAPEIVVRDIQRGRYGADRPVSWWWRLRRARLARTFVRSGIERVLADTPEQ